MMNLLLRKHLSLRAFVCSVGNRCDPLTTALADSIGAAIQTATLVKGNDGTDTLIVRFNKDMDPSWTSGRGLKLNGESIDVDAISKKGTQWVFTVESGVVSVGDMLKIETICSSKRGSFIFWLLKFFLPFKLK